MLTLNAIFRLFLAYFRNLHPTIWTKIEFYWSNMLTGNTCHVFCKKKNHAKIQIVHFVYDKKIWSKLFKFYSTPYLRKTMITQNVSPPTVSELQTWNFTEILYRHYVGRAARYRFLKFQLEIYFLNPYFQNFNILKNCGNTFGVLNFLNHVFTMLWLKLGKFSRF